VSHVRVHIPHRPYKCKVTNIVLAHKR
jgi:hypothetical protein